MPKNYQVKISSKITSPPSVQEISAAQIIAQYFQSNAYFMQCSSIKTADLKVKGILWEIKSPIGNGSSTGIVILCFIFTLLFLCHIGKFALMSGTKPPP